MCFPLSLSLTPFVNCFFPLFTFILFFLFFPLMSLVFFSLSLSFRYTPSLLSLFYLFIWSFVYSIL
jgi:hypothetical protein